MGEQFELREYVERGRSWFAEWFLTLDAVTAARVDRYLRRIESGNFSAVKTLRDGIFELRMDFGPGYRIYFAREGNSIIILLGGGTKRRQDSDIQKAVDRWTRYKKGPETNGAHKRI